MATTLAKRFWKQALATESKGGFGIALDGREVRTPARAELLVPTLALAKSIAAEWDAQTNRIDPTTMPMMRIANSAIDKVTPQKQEIVEMLTAYGDADLLCYRAETPSELVAQQNAAWNPLLDWASKNLGVKLTTQSGVVHRAQSKSDMSRLGALVGQFTPFELAAFHDLVALSGSLIIGLAANSGEQSNAQLWFVSRTDENWQISQWGEDEDEAAKVAVKYQAFQDAARFLALLREIPAKSTG